MRRMMSAVIGAAAAALALSGPARAQCAGINLMENLPAEAVERITARTEATAYGAGNAWQASRDGSRVTVIGTYHMDDPRHAALMERYAPLVEEASGLLVEAGPEEEKALMSAMSKDPSLMYITEGPTLLERLPEETWQRLSRAFEARGIPAVLGAKFQPWYATMVLGIAPCALEQMNNPKGLDGMLIDTAEAAGLPITALEPFDTIFEIFGSLNRNQERDLLESTLAAEDLSEDLSVTLADLYFAGESRMPWELMRELTLEMPGYTPERVAEEFTVMEEILMYRRNRAWIPVIEAEAAKGPIVVAFGALHLSGDDGVLNLLAQSGWTLTALPPAP